MGFDTDTSLRLVREMLELAERLGAQPIRVRDIRMLEGTLAVDITANGTDPVEQDDEDDNRDEQDRRDLSRPAVLRRRMAIIGHAGGPGTDPGPRARG